MGNKDTDKELLRSFLDFLRNEHEMTLIYPMLFKESKTWVKTPPRKGDRVAINITLDGKVPNESQEEVMINQFLDNFGND